MTSYILLGLVCSETAVAPYVVLGLMFGFVGGYVFSELCDNIA